MEFDRSAKVEFNDVANDYDRYRPNYPDKAIADMVGLSEIGPKSRLMEVGCGTGQATVSLAAQGLEIDAVELGSNLAAIAIKNLSKWPRVRVSVGSYEDYKPVSGDYDLIYSAQAFHWVDPGVRLQKSASLLKQKGCLALLRNFTPRLEGTIAVLSERLQKLTGNPIGTPYMPQEINNWHTEISASGLFDNITIKEYTWSNTYTADEYKGLERTYSGYKDLNVDLRTKTAETIKRTIDDAGGTVTREYVCVLIHARKMC
jgi:SAM-dependent methyltransferase